jgi:hypothetical protein
MWEVLDVCYYHSPSPLFGASNGAFQMSYQKTRVPFNLQFRSIKEVMESFIRTTIYKDSPYGQRVPWWWSKNPTHWVTLFFVLEILQLVKCAKYYSPFTSSSVSSITIHLLNTFLVQGAWYGEEARQLTICQLIQVKIWSDGKLVMVSIFHLSALKW